MVAKTLSDHVHTCSNHHMDGAHFCPECRIWWAKRTPPKGPAVLNESAQIKRLLG